MAVAPKIQINQLNSHNIMEKNQADVNNMYYSLPININKASKSPLLPRSQSLEFEILILKSIHDYYKHNEENFVKNKLNELSVNNYTSYSSASEFALSEGAERFVSARIKSIRSSLTLRGERFKEILKEESDEGTDADSSFSNSDTGLGLESAGVRTFRQRLHSFVPENISLHSSQISFYGEGSGPGTLAGNLELYKRYAYDKKGQQKWFFPNVKHSPCMAALYVCIFPPYYKMDELKFVLWMCLVSIAFLYNMFTIFTRTAFTQIQGRGHNLYYWLAADYFSDFIFLMDILVHFKCRYLENGLYITDPKKMRQNYMRNPKFRADLLALFPTDLLYLKFGVWPIFRINRIFKAHSLTELYGIFDVTLKSAHALRMLKTVLYLLLLINLKACAFYTMSRYEGFGINDWVYDGKGRAYLRCFYFGLKTSTGIGNNEGANNSLERIYMTIVWLIGTFSFALFIAQVRAIFEASRRNISEFRKVLDNTMIFLKNSNIPPYLVDKVRMWIVFTWQAQRCLDEQETLGFLSYKMQTDIAINVHFETLSKVKLFQDCERNLLRDLVLKLKPVLYLPDDYICHKGEIGKEMYIINSGIVEVTIGREPNVTILATLKEGSVFGEISLLAITGENRRTANVRSKGFSNLFVLSKENLEITLNEYPEAKVLLEKKAKKILNANKKTAKNLKAAQGKHHRGSLPEVKEEDVKVTAIKEPKLINAVLKLMDPSSKTVQHLRKGEHFIFEKSDMASSPTHSESFLKESNRGQSLLEAPEPSTGSTAFLTPFNSPYISQRGTKSRNDRRVDPSFFTPPRRYNSLLPIDRLRRRRPPKTSKKRNWNGSVSPEIIISGTDMSEGRSQSVLHQLPFDGRGMMSPKTRSELDLRHILIPILPSYKSSTSLLVTKEIKARLDLRNVRIEPAISSLEHISDMLTTGSQSPSWTPSSSSTHSAYSAPPRLL